MKNTLCLMNKIANSGGAASDMCSESLALSLLAGESWRMK